MKPAPLSIPLSADDFVWPYSGMIHDLRVAVDGSCNVLAAVGLFVFTELIGREILRLGGRNPKNIAEDEAFRIFFEDYMGQPQGTGRRVYGAYRSGLLHAFAFQKTEEGVITMVRAADAVTAGPALLESRQGKYKQVNVSDYWRDWQQGLAKWGEEQPRKVLKGC